MSTVILTPSVKVPAVISPLPCCLVIPFLLIISSLPPSFTTPENRKNRTEKKNTPRTRSRLSSLVSPYHGEILAWLFFLGPFLSLQSLSPSLPLFLFFLSFSLSLLRASVCNVWMFFLFFFVLFFLSLFVGTHSRPSCGFF